MKNTIVSIPTTTDPFPTVKSNPVLDNLPVPKITRQQQKTGIGLKKLQLKSTQRTQVLLIDVNSDNSQELSSNTGISAVLLMIMIVVLIMKMINHQEKDVLATVKLMRHSEDLIPTTTDPFPTVKSRPVLNNLPVPKITRQQQKTGIGLKQPELKSIQRTQVLSMNKNFSNSPTPSLSTSVSATSLRNIELQPMELLEPLLLKPLIETRFQTTNCKLLSEIVTKHTKN